MERIFCSFDANQTGAMWLPEFITLSAFIENARAAFKAFDTKKEGAVTLDLQQFLYAAGHVR